MLPPKDRPPRWARQRLAVNAISSSQVSQKTNLEPASAQVMERMRALENLVKDLSDQLELARAAARANSTAGGTSRVDSPESSIDQHRGTSADTSTGNDQVLQEFGRLVLQDTNRNRYVSSGFWSRVNDEVRESVVSLV